MSTSSAVSAELPSPRLIGAEQVVIECEIEGNLPADARRGLCDQLLKRAQQLTHLPVSLATPSDSRGDLRNLREQWKQLRLRVAASAIDVKQGRKTVRFEVTAERPGRPIRPAGPITSTASLIQAQGDWVLLGPVDGLAKLLATSGPPRLHTPIASE